MKKQNLLRYLFCALLYLLILWIAQDREPASEVQTDEIATALDSSVENPQNLVSN